MARQSVLLVAVAAAVAVLMACCVGSAVAGPSDPAYDHDLALRLLFFSGITSCDNHTQIESWTCPGCVNIPGVKYIAGDDHNPQSNYWYVAVDTQFDATGVPMIVVAFRGSSNLKNWLENAQIWFDKTIFMHVGDARIHTGFYNGWSDCRDKVHAAVAQAYALYPNARLAVTGHSLGGALSEIFAVDLAVTEKFGARSGPVGYPLPVFRNVTAYNFGCPRVGDDGWAALVESTVAGYYRLTHDRDIVPMVPPKNLGFDYFHPPTEVWFEDENPDDFIVCDPSNGEDPKCIDSRFIPAFNDDHGQYLGRRISCTSPPLPPKRQRMVQRVVMEQ